MPQPARKSFPAVAPRSAYLTLQGWALGILIEQGVVAECEHHGHRRDRADPEAWNRAREAAWQEPFAGASPEACLKALQEVLRGIGDTCPDC